MIKKILKWTGIVLLVLVAGISITVSARQHLHYEAPFPDIKASKDSQVIARGRGIVLGPSHCVDCHSTVRNVDSVLRLGQEPDLSGGFKFDFALGVFHTPNLTPDTATGLGRLTDGEVARVLRHGVHKNGEAVLPFMPYQNMTDEDLTAVISYLRSLKPVHNAVPANQYSLMGNAVKAFLMKPTGPTQAVLKSLPRDTTAAYGGYLTTTLGACIGCHTKRDPTGAYAGEPMAGGTVFEEEGHPTLVSPNLTPHPSGRIWGWSQADFVKRFRAGRAIPYSHMPWEAYGRMSDNDLKAIYNYLKSLKPVPTQPVPNEN